MLAVHHKEDTMSNANTNEPVDDNADVVKDDELGMDELDDVAGGYRAGSPDAVAGKGFVASPEALADKGRAASPEALADKGRSY